jgi:hypothetical protein
MVIEYEYDKSVEWIQYPTETPANYDSGVENPTGLWSNDCGATQKECSGFPYYGGHNECANGNRIWRTFYANQMHPEANGVSFSGKIWTIDSWDGEFFTVEMKDQNDNVLDSKQFQAWHSQQAEGQHRMQCPGTVGGWQDGYFTV